MGFDTVRERARLKEIRRSVMMGAANITQPVLFNSLAKVGDLGSRFLDDAMTRSSMQGWTYRFEAGERPNSPVIIWYHQHQNNEVYDHYGNKTKMNNREGRAVTVGDILRWLDLGTNPHGPLAPDGAMKFYGKYSYEGKGNEVNKETGQRNYRLEWVEGITPQHFFKNMQTYIKRQGQYQLTEQTDEFAHQISLTLTGKRRKGFVLSEAQKKARRR